MVENKSNKCREKTYEGCIMYVPLNCKRQTIKINHAKEASGTKEEK